MRRKKVNKVVKKECFACHTKKAQSNFYRSNSALHPDGYVPICKECLRDHGVDPETGEINEESFRSILMQIDKPYYRDALQAAIGEFKRRNPRIKPTDVRYHGRDIIQLYMKNIQTLGQYKGKFYADSERDGFRIPSSVTFKEGDELDYMEHIGWESTKGDMAAVRSRNRRGGGDREIVEVDDDDDSFELTDDIINLFGEGYSKSEYRKMYNKYDKLKFSYNLQTNLHQEALVTYVRFKVKEEDATARGDVEEAKKWYDAAQNAATNGKLMPKQLTQADLQRGINSFSEIFRAVEQAVDVVPILPRFKFRPNDACDFIIWCYVNYIRGLQGLPECEYEDIYKFYDKKKKEYIDQYGDPYNIFDEDPTEKLRNTVKKFITLPDDYNDVDTGGDDA